MEVSQTASLTCCLDASLSFPGMSCTEQLSLHPDRFDVTLVEAQPYCGGQAFSIPIPEDKYGAPWMNQGVQGGSYIYHHTLFVATPSPGCGSPGPSNA